MKYDSDNLRRMLAAEYALGTLTGRARRRFETLARGDGRIVAEIRYWEQRLAGLASGLAPVEPPDAIWAALEQRIAKSAKVVPMRRPAAPQPAAATPEKAPPPWRILAGLATAAAVVVAVLIGQRVPLPPKAAPTSVAVKPSEPAPAPKPPYVALLKLPDSDMQWTLSLAPSRGRITVAASGSYAQLGEHSLELWVITAKGPVSLGLLPASGKGEMKMPADLIGTEAPTLAVSLEPVGGSPTGAPTGPVLTSGAAVPLA